ncbi:hypothetical protein [Sporosarcina sp. FSL K6-1508]|uniref:hypothetical protein n=1 Tax=Sporosarcina sp. FSL K6-1508 TaxID=2921553 RepID=UPI0030FA3C4A
MLTGCVGVEKEKSSPPKCIVEDIVKNAIEIEDEREALLDPLEKRMSDTIEMCNRLLTQQLRTAIDESQKQLK